MMRAYAIRSWFIDGLITISSGLAIALFAAIMVWMFEPVTQYVEVVGVIVTDEQGRQTRQFCPGESMRIVWTVKRVKPANDVQVWVSMVERNSSDIIMRKEVPPIPWPNGISQRIVHTEIPAFARPGRYLYIVGTSYALNPLRHGYYEYPPIAFEVVLCRKS